ncbi:Plant-drug/metabolite exporter [Heracleum sosnowskyi]|uniref:WAT1-related protein n=1 Tax=Heracleum sosnowskyi TaxID=360622 RepID=A0AAD8NBA9_9APIA|nr:Plant-drug/metabolite exporter [Heracleum sosnowskyi]
MKGKAQSPETRSKDSTKPGKIIFATSSSGASKNDKNVDRNNSTLNGATVHCASVTNADEESDEIRIVEDQVFSAGIYLLYKLCANDGMNLNVMLAYRFIFAAAFMLPLAFFLERNERSKLTWMVVFESFLSGLLGGTLGQQLSLRGLALTSASFATATANLIPTMTFVLAISFRLEILGWNKAAGKAKLGGTLMGVIGTMILTFYKGPDIETWIPHIGFLENSRQSAVNSHHFQIFGAFLAVGASLMYSLYLILQTKITQRYPHPYSSIALMNTMAAIQSTGFALSMERDWNQWKLGWNIRLLTVVYAGTAASGLVFALCAWCIQKKGPIFVSAFNPLLLIIVTIAEILVLGEKLHVGSVIGAVIIVCGLYAVLWGKKKETEKINQLLPKKSSEH